jgi:hypothetical protein
MKQQLVLLALSLFLVFLPAAFGLPDEACGRVVSVISGDSLGIEMLIADASTNSVDSIKLADIAAPSTITAEGKAAQKYALSLLKNKMVYLDINDNASGQRNKWNQLICVIYLMDSEFRPVWPPVNRILVDGGYARLNEDKNNEFNSSAWWQQPPVFLPGEKSDLLTAMLEKLPQPERVTLVEPLHSPDGAVNGSSTSSVDNSTSSVVKDNSTSSVVKDNSTSSVVKDNSTSSVVKDNSTSSVVMGNSTSSAVMDNSTSSAVMGNSTSSVVKGNSRKGSILEKDSASGRVSIGYRT